MRKPIEIFDSSPRLAFSGRSGVNGTPAAEKRSSEALIARGCVAEFQLFDYLDRVLLPFLCWWGDDRARTVAWRKQLKERNRLARRLGLPERWNWKPLPPEKYDGEGI